MVLAVVVSIAAVAMIAFGSAVYRFQRDLVRMGRAGTARAFYPPHDLL
jgi:hypothetical protein